MCDKVLSCKFVEILMVVKFECEYSKDKLFELYMNEIYLGECVYGFVVVVYVYFGKLFDVLSVGEVVVFVGLFKVLFVFNLVVNFVCVIVWCNYVFGWMYVFG